MAVRIHSHAPAVLPQGKGPSLQLNIWLVGSQRQYELLAENIKLFREENPALYSP